MMSFEKKKKNIQLFENCLANTRFKQLEIYTLVKNESINGKIIIKEVKDRLYGCIFHCYMYVRNPENGEFVCIYKKLRGCGYDMFFESMDRSIVDNLDDFKSIGLNIEGFSKEDKKAMLDYYSKFFKHNGYRMDKII